MHFYNVLKYFTFSFIHHSVIGMMKVSNKEKDQEEKLFAVTVHLSFMNYIMCIFKLQS